MDDDLDSDNETQNSGYLRSIEELSSGIRTVKIKGAKEIVNQQRFLK